MVTKRLQRTLDSSTVRRDERGQAVVIVVLFLIVLLGMAALVIDVGYAYYAQRSLQASADSAALAGAAQRGRSRRGGDGLQLAGRLEVTSTTTSTT